MSIQVLCPFLNWVVCLMLNYMNSLHRLDINPLLDTCDDAKETGRERERQGDWTEGFEHPQGLEAL